MDESDLDALFMELAGETRRSILNILVEGEQKLSHIAKVLDITIQDAHRNSARLVKCGLINKNSNGLFFLTSMGSTITKHLDSFKFLSRYSKFFEEHTMGDLPPKYIRRLGDLVNSKHISGMGPVVENWKRIGNEAQEFIKIITTQYPMDLAITYAEKAQNGIDYQYIIGHNTAVPKARDELLKKTSWRKLVSDGKIKRKMMQKVQVCVTVTEKEACVFFPDLKSNTDMLSGLFSKDPTFRDWCLDVFQYHWIKAGDFDDSKLQKI